MIYFSLFLNTFDFIFHLFLLALPMFFCMFASKTEKKVIVMSLFMGNRWLCVTGTSVDWNFGWSLPFRRRSQPPFALHWLLVSLCASTTTGTPAAAKESWSRPCEFPSFWICCHFPRLEHIFLRSHFSSLLMKSKRKSHREKPF